MPQDENTTVARDARGREDDRYDAQRIETKWFSVCGRTLLSTLPS